MNFEPSQRLLDHYKGQNHPIFSGNMDSAVADFRDMFEDLAKKHPEVAKAAEIGGDVDFLFVIFLCGMTVAMNAGSTFNQNYTQPEVPSDSKPIS